MSRRPVLFALSLVALAATACADTTAPTPSARQLQPSGQAAKDVVETGTCRGGYTTGIGKTC
jgi:hypothetical protein